VTSAGWQRALGELKTYLEEEPLREHE